MNFVSIGGYPMFFIMESDEKRQKVEKDIRNRIKNKIGFSSTILEKYLYDTFLYKKEDFVDGDFSALESLWMNLNYLN